MAVQLIRKVRDRQPSYKARENRALGLLSALSFTSHNMALLGGATVAGRLSGAALIGDGTAACATRKISISASPPLFVVVHVTRLVTPGASETIYSISSDVDIGAFLGIRTTTDSIGFTVFYRTVDGGEFFEVGNASGITTTGKDYCVVGVVPTLNSADAYIYVNGVKYNFEQAAGGTLGSTSVVYTNETVCAVRRNGSTAGASKWCVYNCGFGKGISERAAKYISLHPLEIFEPETIPLFFSTVTAQYARPTSDVSSGTWTASSGSDLYAMLDETAASDADYITTTGASTCEVALNTLSDPSSSTGHIVRYRISASSGGITVRLRQGTTTIATWTHASAPTSLTTYEQTLTGGEADSITDYSALRLQFEAT
jgi:hypothetical protein